MGHETLSEADLRVCYEEIKGCRERQHENYAKFLKDSGHELVRGWQLLGKELCVDLEIDSGRIRYADTFHPLDLHVEICYIRHGKTEGNTEPRVFQGLVDYPSNQLNSIGQEQAVAAAERMESFVREGHWKAPDLIVSSPLQRAQQTAAPYRRKNPNMPFSVLPEVAEMRFGSWDNVKVKDLPGDNICHLFYLEQNAVVKTSEPHRVCMDNWVHPEWLNGQIEIQAENFLECMKRQRAALHEVERVAEKVMEERCSDERRKARVVIYGHSMAGAAVSMLLGFGKTYASKSSTWLGFDGSYIMPNATPTLLIPDVAHEKQ